MAALSSPAWADPPLPGAVFTAKAPATPSGPCTTVNSNIYASKADVWLNGGPDHPGSASLLPNQLYYVKVTDPSGATLLGSSALNPPTSTATPVLTNSLGNFSKCYQLQEIVTSPTTAVPGYDDSPNNGGEYKVWVSTLPSVANNSTKTDNFKVGDGASPPPGLDQIVIRKFYDANVNGVLDAGDIEIFGWKVDLLGFAPQSTAASFQPSDGSYTAEEYAPVQGNWYATYVQVPGQGAVANAASTPLILNSTGVSVAGGGTREVDLGNVCTGPGGGLTLGYWSNKNGAATIAKLAIAPWVTLDNNLNLKSANGSDFDPKSTSALASWLLGGNAVNMAYMLSVQLAAMELNVLSGAVNGNAQIYAPATTSANALGFATVTAVMGEANASLGNFSLTLAGVPQRSYQEYLKNALDNANNNKTFVQSTPCAFSFSPAVP